MKVITTGSTSELNERELRKLQNRIQKIGKLVDRRTEGEAHVVVASVRHLKKVDVTLNHYGHAVIGSASNPDLFTAYSAAVDKLEQQLVKLRGKWRDLKRGPEAGPGPIINGTLSPAREPAPKRAKKAPKLIRVAKSDRRKPMTAEEAMLDMSHDENYVVYRDADSGRLSVVLRRKDGNFDLVES